MRTAITVLLVLAGPSVASAADFSAPGTVKTLNCAACHGPGGQSPSDAMPILAGMWPEYLKKAIQDYAGGRRASAEMEPYAKQVLELGVDDVAAYFAAQKREPTKIKTDRAAVDRGRTAAQQCAICHGPEGRGDRAKLIPDLSGQPPGYLRTQMI